MPTVMTHAVVGVGLGSLFTSRKMPPMFWLTTVALTMAPDLDVWAFRLGIPYAAPLGHRGFTHSLIFALFAGCTAALLTHRRIGGRLADLCGFFFLKKNTFNTVASRYSPNKSAANAFTGPSVVAAWTSDNQPVPC